jgi:hypothetical protein
VTYRALTRRTYAERAPSPEAYTRLCMENFGPLVAIRSSLRDQAGRPAALDRALLDAVIRWNHGRADGAVEITYEYLLVVAQKRFIARPEGPSALSALG